MNVFLVDIVEPRVREPESNARMAELESLVNTFGGFVVLHTIQRRKKPYYKLYIGSGKLEEIAEEMKEQNAELLILGNILKPRQLYQVNEFLRPYGMKAWDRVDLILKIFDKHANTAEAKMQIELASIKHMGPRIFGMGMELSKQGAGIGTKGIGETNTEIMKRHLKEKTRLIEKKLLEYGKMRRMHRERRIKNQVPSVGIVGYTNAGKSSLLNSLTKKEVLAENKLFATLGTTAAMMFVFPEEGGLGREIMLHDTIGFIRDLPPQLIKAFRSTLEDSIETDILLHVLDASDPEMDRKMYIVNDILDEIGATQPRFLVLNKMDLLSVEEQESVMEKYAKLSPISVSADEKL